MTQTIKTIRIATQGPAGRQGLYPQPSWNAEDVPYVRDTLLAHDGGIWLALRDTSVEPAAGVPEDWASWMDFGDAATVATLGEDGKIPLAQLPAIAITDVFEVSSQGGMLALDAERGDIAIRSDLNKTFVLGGEPAATLANWKELKTPTDAVLSVAGRTGAVTLSKSDVGLNDVPNVDATARANHTGTQAAATVTGLGNVAPLNAGTGLAINAGSLQTDLGQANIAGLTTDAAPQFAGLQFSTDVFLARAAANILAQRNGATAQALRLYASYTDASNGEWLQMDAGVLGGASYYSIGPVKNGTGTLRHLQVGPGAGASNAAYALFTMRMSADGDGFIAILGSATANNWGFGTAGHWLPCSNNGKDIGSSALKIRDLYAGRNVYLSGLPTSNPAVAGQLWSNGGVLIVSAG